MLYDRKIKYLDYYESGARVGGVGFAKLEMRENTIRMEVSVKGLHETDSFVRDVVLQSIGSETVLGQIEIREGKGAFRYCEHTQDGTGKAGIPYGEFREIRIPIGGSREIICSLQDAVNRIVKPRQPEDADNALAVPSAALPEETVRRELESHAAELQSADAIRQEASQPQEAAQQEASEPEVPRPEIIRQEASQPQEAAQQEASEPEVPQREIIQQEAARPEGADERSVKLMEDKWMQLSAMYPHIQPFGDDRDYLSLNPSDFVLFPAKNYRAVNNSFLLHGYYNYHHLILARVEHRGRNLYYIGVPGNYYDREKQVAMMFGFESFESESEPVKTGDFGYYMMRTEL